MHSWIHLPSSNAGQTRTYIDIAPNYHARSFPESNNGAWAVVAPLHVLAWKRISCDLTKSRMHASYPISDPLLELIGLGRQSDKALFHMLDKFTQVRCVCSAWVCRWLYCVCSFRFCPLQLRYVFGWLFVTGSRGKDVEGSCGKDITAFCRSEQEISCIYPQTAYLEIRSKSRYHLFSSLKGVLRMYINWNDGTHACPYSNLCVDMQELPKKLMTIRPHFVI